MIKTNKYVNSLETLLEKIDAKICELEEKIDEVFDIAGDDDRDLTTREQNRVDKWNEMLAELHGEYEDVESAIEYLRDYAEE